MADDLLEELQKLLGEEELDKLIPPPKPPDPSEALLALQQFPRPLPDSTMYDLDPQPEAPEPFRLSDPLPIEDSPVDRRVERLPITDISDDPFERAALRTRRSVVGDRPLIEPEFPREAEGPYKPESWSEMFERSTRPVRMGAAEVGKMGALLYELPAAGAQFLADVEKMTPGEQAPISARRVGGVTDFPIEHGMEDAAAYLRELGTGVRGGVETVTGTTGLKPETPVEHAGVWTGTYLTPMKGATVPLTLTGVAARAGLTALSDAEIPIPSLTTEAQAQGFQDRRSAGPSDPFTRPQVQSAPNANAPAIPKPMAPGTTVVPVQMPNVPYAPSVTHTDEKSKKEPRPRKHAEAPVIPEGMEIPPPDLRITSEPNLKQGQGRLDKKTGLRVGAETDEQFAARKENAWILKEIQARTYTESAKQIFMSAGGKQTVTQGEYTAMGVAGATLVGMVLAPKAIRAFSAGGIFSTRTMEEALASKVAKAAEAARPVEAAAPGTMAFSSVKDVLRLGDDIDAPASQILARNGAHPDVVDSIDKNFRITTRNGGRALADSAVDLGRMETPSFRFQAPMSISNMARASTPASEEYLRVLDAAEQLRAARNEPITRAVERQRLNPSAPGKAVFEARKSADAPTQELRDMERRIADIEQANPGIADMAKANQAHNAELVRFQRAGEYSTLTPEQAAAALASERHALGLGVNHTGTVMEAQAARTRAAIKTRLDNEAVGRYVDASIKVQPGSFVRVTAEQLKENPGWGDNTVRFKRNGVEEIYTTDPFVADVLKLDMPSIAWGGNAMYATKRWLEATTTGSLAPNFAVTSAIRSYWIAKFTTEQGFKAPTAIGSVMAVPQQLLPQLAKSISRGLDHGSGGTLSQIFPPAWSESLSRRLATVYDESVYAQLKAGGSHRGSFVEQQARAAGLEKAAAKINALAEASGGAPYRATQHFWNAWRASIESIHNGPGFNFVVRNMGKESTPELALRARRLTGDPRAGGQFLVGEGRQQRFIRYESDNKLDQAVVNTLKIGYGIATETGKAIIPWWNPTIQGMKRIGEAYLHDPVRFTRSTAMYAMAPAVGLLYWAKYLDSQGGDPKGRSYVDWILNGRSAFNRQMNFSIPIWGQPVEQSPEVTFFHELNPFKRAAEIGWHHMLGSDIPKEDPRFPWLGMPDNVTQRRPLGEDLKIAAYMFLDTALTPPAPPLANAFLGTLGIRGPQGIYGGTAFPVQGDPFNQNGGLPNSLELTTRAMFGGVAESLGGFYAAASNSEGSYWNAVKNGVAQVRDINVKKTPILRDIVGTLPDVSNVTDLAKEVFEHQKEFNDLDRFYKKWTVGQGAIGVGTASKPGEIAVSEQYGLTRLNAGNPGLSQDQPTNPMYLQFMQEFHNAFMKESPNMVKGQDQGGVAFKSLWRNYGRATQKIERLKDINHGTYDRWQRTLNETPEGQLALEELKQNQIDTTNRAEVVAFYRKKQFEALRVINYVRRAVEEKMGVKLKDMHPFVPAQEQGQPFMFPDLL